MLFIMDVTNLLKLMNFMHNVSFFLLIPSMKSNKLIARDETYTFDKGLNLYKIIVLGIACIMLKQKEFFPGSEIEGNIKFLLPTFFSLFLQIYITFI